MQYDFRWQTPNLKRIGWDDLVVGWERTWDMPITLDAVGWYADLSEDPNPWYGALGSPWGAPVAPPLLMSRLCFRITDPLGKMIGFLNTWNRTETLAPALVGTMARFHGRISEKFERKGRRYVRYVIDVNDAETGRALLHEEKEYVVAPSTGEKNAGEKTA